MIEYISPIVSLFKLIVDGLSKAGESIKGSQKKEIQRKIIEIQLALEDIIDRAQEILSAIEELSSREKIAKKDIEPLQHLIYRQRNKIYRLMDLLVDEVLDNIMKLFVPEARRMILSLMNRKNSFLSDLVSNVEEIKVTKNQLIIKSVLIDWNHEAFIEQGHSYLRQVAQISKRSTVPISNHIDNQKQIVNALIECSKEMSDLIKKQIKIEDVVIRKRRK
jgi:hypothetical protein